LAGQERLRRLGGRFAATALWDNFVLASKHIEKKMGAGYSAVKPID